MPHHEARGGAWRRKIKKYAHYEAGGGVWRREIIKYAPLQSKGTASETHKFQFVRGRQLATHHGQSKLTPAQLLHPAPLNKYQFIEVESKRVKYIWV